MNNGYHIFRNVFISLLSERLTRHDPLQNASAGFTLRCPRSYCPGPGRIGRAAATAGKSVINQQTEGECR
jgi:hypothetical protein